MKRRVRKIANFFAFNLLFFALYLNFIHKDKIDQITTQQRTAAFSGTVVVDNPEKKNTESAAMITQDPVGQKSQIETGSPLKLSIN